MAGQSGITRTRANIPLPASSARDTSAGHGQKHSVAWHATLSPCQVIGFDVGATSNFVAMSHVAGLMIQNVVSSALEDRFP